MRRAELREFLLRRWPQSLRGRVILAFTVSSGLVALVLALSVYSIGHSYMENQRMHSANRLARAYSETLRPLSVRLGTETALDAIDPPDGTILLVRHDTDWYSTDSALGAAQLLPPDLIDDPVAGTERVTVAERPYFRVGVRLGQGGDLMYEFSPVIELESNLRRLRQLLIASALVATMVGAGLGVWASRRVLSPLHQVSGTAARIASGELGLRLVRSRDRDLSTTIDAFNAMVDSLQKRIERERRLVGDVSHELRTPLTTLMTSVEVMNRHADELPPRSRRALDFLSAELEHLRRLLDDMLELARLEAGVHRGDTELLSAGELMTHTLAGRAYAPELLSISAEVTIRGRKLELERAVGNLLDNADRHGGGVVGVSVARDESDVVITVDDAGPGVPPAERERIFERFATAPTVRGSDAGSGIGLALVTETVAAHGGRVEYQDRPGGGARFTIRLPRIASGVA
ncbi:HAMP domain-containing protein [Nocardia sp. ET3-3]|uniref:histidine kinase n=1 Tax=Nocardia terrae TaxID=2675851 RepID=A0A7K1UUR0_9NOCA|nr:HAMP domain-containing sensor histidine kinase [Nocardia terrae]MVU78055.1 HAMP domain-containing protein [Nocardia terrae]